MDLSVLKTPLYFIIGGFLLFLGLTVARDNFQNRLNRVAGAMLLFAGIGPLSLAVSRLLEQAGPVEIPLQETIFYSMHWAWELFFPCLLIFALLFPIDRLKQFRLGRLTWLLFLPAILHILFVLLFRDVSGIITALNSGFVQEGFFSFILRPLSVLASQFLRLAEGMIKEQRLVFGVVNVAFTACAFILLENGKKYVSNPRLLVQSRIVIWAFRIALPSFATYWVTSLMKPSPLVDIVRDLSLVIALVGGAGLLTYAIVRHQFLDVQLVFRHSLIYTLTSAILVGLYVVLGMEAESLLSPYLGSRATVVSWVLLLLLLLLFQPINSWLDNLIRSMFMRTRSDHRNIIERFSRQIISQFDPVQLRSTIDETLKTALLVENVYFVLFDDSIGEYAVMPSDDFRSRSILNRSDSMLRGINLLDTPTYFNALSSYSENSDLAELLAQRKVKLILPMKDSRDLLGFLALTNKAAGYRYTPEDLNLLGVLSNQMVSALTNARLYVESLERLRLQEEVTMARQIQLELLPHTPPSLPGLAIVAQSIPSRTVGGDFYDFLPIEGSEKLGIVIADASGKGMPAALLVAQIQAILRSEVNNRNSISVILTNMNRQVTLSTSSEKYVTLFYGEYDPTTGMFEYANAGHNYPILVRQNGEMEFLIDGGPIIGAFPEIEYRSANVKLSPHDSIFFFTDGLSEAMDEAGTEYGEERLRKLLCEQRHQNPDTLLKMVLEDVNSHDPSSPPRDDTTIIALKISKIGQNHG